MITCRISKLFYPAVDIKTNMVTMRTNELQTLSHIVTSHGLHKRHQRHWNDIPDFQCDLCQEGEEDSWHLWAYCPALSTERNQLMGLSRERALLKFFDCKMVKELLVRNESPTSVFS